MPPVPSELNLLRLPHGDGLPLPSYATAEAAGLDLSAAIAEAETIELKPFERALIPTGFSLEIPQGYEGQVRPRSGLALKNGITILNAPGTIDSDYRGEVKVLLVNLGAEPFRISRGARIAQLVIAPVTRVRLVERREIAASARGAGGFGSTGLHAASSERS
jgi:dUTP pyrophosphatase